MIIKTTVCDLTDGKFNNLSDLAHTMGISVSQVYRVKTGKRTINQKFITGAVKAFPQYRLDQLFYLALEAHLGNNEQPRVTTAWLPSIITRLHQPNLATPPVVL